MATSDYSQLSKQPHELNYLLRKLNKRETEKNRATLCKWEIDFKAGMGGQNTKSYTKDEFYFYISAHKNCSVLE